MSIIALASAKGAPGVTTATLAMAGVWSGRVAVAECDPFGGTIAARFGLPPSPGLLSLASQSRHQLRAESLWSHLQQLPPGGVPVLLGVQTFEQAMALGRVWTLLPQVLAGLGVDVLVDCGRLLPDAPANAVLQAGTWFSSSPAPLSRRSRTWSSGSPPSRRPGARLESCSSARRPTTAEPWRNG